MRQILHWFSYDLPFVRQLVQMCIPSVRVRDLHIIIVHGDGGFFDLEFL